MRSDETKHRTTLANGPGRRPGPALTRGGGLLSLDPFSRYPFHFGLTPLSIPLFVTGGEFILSQVGDKWSSYCILGLEGQTLAEGQLRTMKQHVAEFFRALDTARVVLEVGTHSAWVREIVCGYGHEVLVANPRLMDGPKRRKRKNDRIDANKLARLGRVDPQSLYPIEHRSTEVRQDLVMLRARDALVAARTQIINVTRGLVKSLGTQLPKCSSPSFAQKVEETVPVEIREAVLPLVRLTVVEFGNPLYQDVVDSYVLEGKGLSQVGVKQI